MSWINLSDSLNTLKGKISDFANNVLADEDEGSENKNIQSEEVQKNSTQQELNEQQNDFGINSASKNWQRDLRNQENVSNKSNLEEQIKTLKNENKDLIQQLEQLDLENQENISKMVIFKDKLQQENNYLKEENIRLKQYCVTFNKQEDELKLKLKVNEDEYEQKYKNILQENQKLKLELEDLMQEVSVLKSSNSTFQQNFENCKITNEEMPIKHQIDMKQVSSENKLIYLELQKSKETILAYEKKSIENEENFKKLAFILESYENEVSSLKNQLENEKIQNQKLLVNTGNEEIVSSLKYELNDTKKNHQQELDLLQNKIHNLKSIVNDIKLVNATYVEERSKKDKDIEKLVMDKNSAEEELNLIKLGNSHLKSNFEVVKKENDKLKMQLENLTKNNEKMILQLHKKYVNIITENIKKIQNCDKPTDFQQHSCEEDKEISEFSMQVQNILKILLDFKCKCEILEKNVYDLSEEKTNMLTEKNYEIERLLQNSEILSQEVITKTQTIKEYENECNELAKNNELLINELEIYKNNSGLQTISESNEDNMVLLESQLENANKRIEDLGKIINDYKKSDLIPGNKPENTKMEEIAKKENDYQELLNNFDQLQINCDTFKLDLVDLKEELRISHEEKLNLKSSLEKLKSDYENTEYQLSEININTDSLKDEIYEYKKKVDILLKENNKLQLLNEESLKNNEDIRAELNVVREKLLEEKDYRKKLEVQIRNFSEKLQNAKMIETSLKLQYDTLSKEALSLSEVKNNVEICLNKTNLDMAKLQENFVETQNENIHLKESYQELQDIAVKRAEQIQSFETLVLELQNKCKKFENLTSFIKENDELEEKYLSKNVFKTIQEMKINLTEDEHLFEIEKQLTISENENNHAVPMDVKNNKEYNRLKLEFETLLQENNDLKLELDRLNHIEEVFHDALKKCSALENQIQEISNSRNELINIITTKHQENVTYHNEIQRLFQLLSTETEKCKDLEIRVDQLKNIPLSKVETKDKNKEIEKLLEYNNALREKYEVLAKNLLEQSRVQKMSIEKSYPSEKELTLQKQLDRLQAHLIELEEHYTQELLQAEQRNIDLRSKITEVEEREKNSSTKYTSVNIRANQQMESLQNQLQMVITERDGLRQKISDAEDINNKQAAALTNLQLVLEQFQKDKEKDVQKETERIKRQINKEKYVQEELRKEISNLKSQLEESKQGLQAASRISDQLESSKRSISHLKEEIMQVQDKLSKSEELLRNVSNQADGKVDKSLVKNLLIGFVSSNNNLNRDQMQILKIFATVLDFNQLDHEKVNLNKPQQGSWLTSFMAPQTSNQNMSQDSLSQAFIKFLENESKPRTIPSLLNASTSESTKSISSKPSTPHQSPIVLSEIVLPSFVDFAQSRNSSSILKDVLKEN